MRRRKERLKTAVCAKKKKIATRASKKEEEGGDDASSSRLRPPRRQRVVSDKPSRCRHAEDERREKEGRGWGKVRKSEAAGSAQTHARPRQLCGGCRETADVGGEGDGQTERGRPPPGSALVARAPPLQRGEARGGARSEERRRPQHPAIRRASLPSTGRERRRPRQRLQPPTRTRALDKHGRASAGLARKEGTGPIGRTRRGLARQGQGGSERRARAAGKRRHRAIARKTRKSKAALQRGLLRGKNKDPCRVAYRAGRRRKRRRSAPRS